MAIGADEGPALLRDWVQPEYPEAARQAKTEGNVVVHFVVELDGTVSRAMVVKSSSQLFEAPALAAVRQWKFTPALSDKKPVAMGMRGIVFFRLSQLEAKTPRLMPVQAELPVPLPKTPAKIKFSPNPVYPDELTDMQLSGRVIVAFTVSTEGRPINPKVRWTPHAAFVRPALESVAQTEFEPAHQGPLLLTQEQEAPLDFTSLGVSRAAMLAANHIRVSDGSAPEVLPTPQVLVRPVYPLTRLLAGEGGTAAVEFTVDGQGKVGNAAVLSASEPEYGAALLAAVERWQFNGALKDGQGVTVTLRADHEFTAGPTTPLVAALQPGGAGIASAKGLDGRVTPLWQVAPVYPASLRAEKLAGDAKVEFIIDQEGRVRLPKVLSASQEAFGWAAMTALSQWVFAPPTRGGQPTEVRVVVPVSFPVPKE